MKIFLDCLPCLLRQALEVSRRSTDNEELQGRIMEEATGFLGNYRAYRTAPELIRDMYGIMRSHTGVFDPYREIKQNDIQTALSLLPKLRRFMKDKQDRLYWALKVAVTGNVLDSAVNTGVNIEESIDHELNMPFAICDAEIVEQQIKEAKSLLVIGDNAGETVFDRILLEELSRLNITYAVRNAPIINDAVLEDAVASGLDKHARIISTGCDVPGVILKECSSEFLDVFYNADVVISKGQANYETLSDCDRNISFLLKIKCPVLSDMLDVSMHEYVLKYMGI